MQMSDTDQLLSRAKQGDSAAVQQLFTRYNHRLRAMIKAVLDPRLSSRLDASDVLQDAYSLALNRLPEFLEERPIGFYPWLRQLVRQQLVTVYRRHVDADRRSVRKEQPFPFALSDDSALQLAERLTSNDTAPGVRLIREESRQRIRAAIGRLPGVDREVLYMRCIEQLSVQQTAEALAVSESAVKSRFSRALQKITRWAESDG
jgi:RNA polymerase sigma-70 factor, ECF subfamily